MRIAPITFIKVVGLRNRKVTCAIEDEGEDEDVIDIFYENILQIRERAVWIIF